MKPKHLQGIGAAWLLFVPGAALAHSGVHDGGLLSGLAHPFSGIDHLVAMLLVGVWAAARIDGRKALLVPCAFVLCMTVAAACGAAGLGMPWMEAGIAFSVLFLSLLLLGGLRLPMRIAAPLVGVLALFHGNAHGLEMPASQATLYFGGFITATVALHLMGMLLGRMLVRHAWALRGIGLAGSVIGTSLMLGA